MHGDTHQSGPESPSTGESIPLALPVGRARPITSSALPPLDRGPMYLDRATASSVWLDLLAFTLGITAAILLLGILAAAVSLLARDLDERLLQLLLLPLQAMAWVAVVALILKQRGQSGLSVGWRRDQVFADACLGLGAAGAAYAAFLGSTLLLMLVWPAGAKAMQANEQAITEMLPPLPVALFALQIIVGFYEELVFRGFLLTRLRRVLKSWWLAIVVSSTLFAVPHVLDQEPVAAIPLFSVGVTFCIFTLWRKSVIPAMVGHAVFNTGQILAVYLLNPEWR